ncbi:NHLP leader peptide family RiPP precursor [Flavobacterium hydrophilum]|uniref:TOMM propeptide domain-containing protein n=1 Tax=Flavobacterium hydrophilum TaxID=2211445 RepID=A0A2V4CLT7_9FLAO|nr:NHLP leader peptide family RiPP precursor [Flavobacterium hydrophilum]PXY46694.1 TOMM propeptide domain-containing protein [Flavobacterium hydrophilum]
MILTEEQKRGQDVFFRIITEAWENDNFKKSLLTNPEETLEKFFGRSLPTGKKIKVADQSNPEYIYINIPVKPQMKDVELDEKKLDTVSGGSSNGTGMTDYESLYDSLRSIYK